MGFEHQAAKGKRPDPGKVRTVGEEKVPHKAPGKFVDRSTNKPLTTVRKKK